MTQDDCFKQIEIPEGVTLSKCPVCSSESELFRFSEDANGATETLVMCSNSAAFGPQTGVIYEGCLLYMPPPEFYRGTIREAVKYWNEYAQAILDQRQRKDPQASYIYNWLTLVEQRLGTPAAMQAARVLKDFYEGVD